MGHCRDIVRSITKGVATGNVGYCGGAVMGVVVGSASAYL